ncbi:universal stress protein [Haloarcula sp. GH36]|uniref:universal stress protein n=1 Tax=Haloarcula montana TaxID=3111776 RepID=UPI002D794D0C|nr:universal stress protein [Haloarcula sp. GH36]
MGQRILVPVDDSERAKEGLRYALENFPDAEFTALHVVSSGTGDLGAFSGPSGETQEEADEGDTDTDTGSASAPGDLGAFPGPGGEPPDQTDEDDAGDPALGMAREIASEHGAEIKTDRMRGRPDRAIVKYLEENEYDLVVLGSHGRDGVARVLLGSVAEKVVRRSPIPVLVVR